MFTQASIFNRSWFKAQRAKLLVLIVLIVPLLGMKLRGNKEAAAENIYFFSFYEKAARSSDLNSLKKSGSLSFHGSLPQWRTPDKVSFLQSPRKGPGDSSPKKYIFPSEQVIRNFNDDLARFQHLKDEAPQAVYPEQDRELVLHFMMDGYLSLAGEILKAHPNLLRHDSKRFAFSHTAIEALSESEDQAAEDHINVTWILEHSDCNEWMLKGFKSKWMMNNFADRINGSCTYLRHLKHFAKDAQTIDALVKMYQFKLTECNKDNVDSITTCSLKS